MVFFFFQAEDGIRDADVTGVQTCALPIYGRAAPGARLELDLDLDGGIAARVEDLASVDAGDRGHVLRTSVRTRSRRARGSARPAGRAAPANASSPPLAHQPCALRRRVPAAPGKPPSSFFPPSPPAFP